MYPWLSFDPDLVARNSRGRSLRALRELTGDSHFTDGSVHRSAEHAKVEVSQLALRWTSIGERLTSIRPFAWAEPDTLDSSGHVPKE